MTVNGAIVSFLCCIASVLVAGQPYQPGSPWPKQGGAQFGRSNYSTCNSTGGAYPLHLEATVSAAPFVSGSVDSWLLDAGGNFLVTSNGSICSLACTSAQASLNWQFFPRDGGIFNSRNIPVLGFNGTLFNVDSNGVCYSLNSTSGALRWFFNFTRVPLFGGLALSPDGDTLFIPTADAAPHFLYPITTWNGKVYAVYTHALDFIQSTPAVSASGVVYFASLDGNVYALAVGAEGRGGILLWKALLGSGIQYTSVLLSRSGKTVYTGCNDGRVYALNSTSGAQLWNVSLYGLIQRNIAQGSNDTMFVPSFSYVSLTSNLTALSATGVRVWQYQFPAGAGYFAAQGPTISGDGVLYVVTENAMIFSFNATTGGSLGTYALSSTSHSEVIISSKGLVHIIDDFATVYTLSHAPCPTGTALNITTASPYCEPLTTVSGYQSGAPWPRQGGGKHGLSASNTGGSYAFHSEWSISPAAQAAGLEGFVDSWLLDAQGNFLISSTYAVYSLAASGTQSTVNWKYPIYTGGVLNLGVIPALGSDATFYNVDNAGVLHAVNSTSGLQRWNVTLKDSGQSCGIAISPDATTLYVPNSWFPPLVLYAISTSTGRVKWNYTMLDYSFSTPAISSTGTVYFTSYDGFIYALVGGATNATLWKKNLGHPISETSVVISPSGGTVYTGSRGGIFFALNASSGVQQWNASLGGALTSNVAQSKDGKLFVSAGFQAGGVYSGNVTALSPSGMKLWAYNYSGYIAEPGLTLSGDGLLYFSLTTSTNCVLHALNASSGKLLGTFSFSALCGRNEIIIDSAGLVFLQERAGSIFALSMNACPEGTTLNLTTASPYCQRPTYTALSGYQSGSPWPRQGGGQYGLSLYNASGAFPLHAEWTLSAAAQGVGLQGSIDSWLLDARGAFLISCTSFIYSMSVSSSQPTVNWQFFPTNNGRFHLQYVPALSNDDTLYTVDDKLNLYAINSTNGVLRWNTTLASGPYLGGLALSPDGLKLYIPTASGAPFLLLAISTQSGLVIWSYSVGSRIQSAPAVSAVTGAVYFSCYDGFLHVLAGGKTNATLWRLPLSTYIQYTSAVLSRTGDTVYSGSSSGLFFAMNASTGSQLWNVSFDGLLFYSIAVGPNGVLYVPCRSVSSYPSNMTALSPAGKLLWTFPFPSGWFLELTEGPTLSADGVLFFALRSSAVVALNATTGVSLGTYELSASYSLSEIIISSAGLVHVIDIAGNLYALSFKNCPTGMALNGTTPSPFCYNIIASYLASSG